MSPPEASEAVERQRLLAHLAAIGIDAPIVPYPAHSTVEEGKRLRGQMAGTFTKNLLLKDKMGRLFFVTAFEDTVIDLKTFHTRVGGQGRVGFVGPDLMQQLLHVAPGTATPLALMNDTERQVTLVVDAALSGAELLNFHPMTHTESIGLTPEQFAAFAASCGKKPVTVPLS